MPRYASVCIYTVDAVSSAMVVLFAIRSLLLGDLAANV